MQINQAVSIRVKELLSKNHMTQYQLSSKSGLPRSTVSNIVNCAYPSMKLRIIHELCQGFGIGVKDFVLIGLTQQPPQIIETIQFIGH